MKILIDSIVDPESTGGMDFKPACKRITGQSYLR